MEKIKLSNGGTLEINKISESNNVMNIEFNGLELSDLREIFDKPCNLSTIEVLTEGESVSGVYNGYKKVEKYTTVEAPHEAKIITVVLSKPNEIEARLTAAEDAIDTLILSGLGVL